MLKLIYLLREHDFAAQHPQSDALKINQTKKALK
jgi:hypothetical protein